MQEARPVVLLVEDDHSIAHLYSIKLRMDGYRVHGANTPSDDLYRGTLGVTAKHLAATSGRARQALLERRVDALWSLGEFAEARREAFAAALSEPRLLGHPRFVKRLLGLAAPTRVLEGRR